ncbi:MAG: serine hydrolase [Cardiobacteriaceae bacterium]|nr:serine hydrolase [Cardiobacteriaceae bacterium]
MDLSKRRFLRSLFYAGSFPTLQALAEIKLESIDDAYPATSNNGISSDAKVRIAAPSNGNYQYDADYGVKRTYVEPNYGQANSNSQSQYQNSYNRPVIASGNLNDQISELIRQKRALGHIARDEHTAWQVVDINSGRHLLDINHHLPLQAASMIKPFVCQAYFFQNRRNPGLFPITDDIINTMRLMIVKSSNTSTNKIIDRVGGPYAVQSILRREAGDIFRNTIVVESIPAGGKTYRNRASCGDYTRFMQALWRDKLPQSKLLKSLMSIKNPDRIATRTQFVPQNLTIYDKTGSTSQCCGDFGIVEFIDKHGYAKPYSFAAVIEKSRSCDNYGSWIKSRGNVIREVSDLVYLHIEKMHNG